MFVMTSPLLCRVRILYDGYDMGEIGKFAYIGTSCIGKSTLLEHSTLLNGGDVILVDEAAREYFAANRDVANRFSVETQGKVQALALVKEQAAQARASQTGRDVAIICDRSVLDAPAYVYSQGDVDGANQLLERVRLWLPTYSAIFLLDPADVLYEPDPIRDESEATRQLFHTAFLEFFDANGIPYELLSGSPDERLAVVSNRIAATAISASQEYTRTHMDI